MNQEALKAGANQSIAPGKVVTSQGALGNALIILHQGTISLRFAADRTSHDLATSFYAISIKGPAILGASAIISGMPNPYYALTETPCVISVYGANKASLLKIIQTKPQIAILMLKTLIRQIRDLEEKVNSVYSMIKYAANTQYVLGLAFSKIQPDQFTADKMEVTEGHDQTILSARNTVSKLLAKNISIPDNLELGFLKKDFTGIIGLDYQNELSIDEEQMDFFQKFTELAPAILSAISQKSPDFISLTTQRIASEFIKITADIADAYQESTLHCDLIFQGQYSWIEKYALQAEVNLKNQIYLPALNNVFHFLMESIRVLESQYQKTWTVNKYSLESVSVNKINQYLTFCKQQQANDAAQDLSMMGGAEAADADTARLVKDSLTKILQYAELEADKQKEFRELIHKFKQFENPMESEGEAKKIKRAMTNIYWNVYEKTILKYLAQKDNNRLIEVFLLCGFLDESLLLPEQINFIFANVKRHESRYPIHDIIGWFELIYQGKLTTSISELGVTFFEVLKQENRDAGWKRESDLPASFNNPEARIKFEIRNMIAPTVKLTSGTIINHLPILTKFHFTQSIERTLVSPKRLEDEIDKLLSFDFGAFHREILYINEKMGINKEFIQVQIIPNILLVPSIGPVFQFWQEREGNNRTSRGRILCPIFATDDLYDMLLHASGAYRWELTKTLLGPDWNNITSGSLTADYTDYVQFYKKNRDLSPEVKEKLASEFKRFRDDRARFINDYITWVKYESEGTQRLNKVIRKIMAKHIPFTKPIRDNLLKLPNFQDIIQKSINVKKRKAIELEPRYKKYRTENNGIIPPELESTMKYYLLDF